MVADPIARLARPDSAHDLVIVAHPEIARLEAEAEHLAARLGWPLLEVGRELAARVADTPVVRRPYQIPRAFEELVGAVTSTPAIAHRVDLPFEPSFQLDPLALFRRVARIGRLVVLWPGSYRADVLGYAVPDHEHRRYWPRPGIPIVSLA